MPELGIRTYRDADWSQVYQIFREVVDAGETYAYDPNWSEEQAKAVWVEPAPAHTVVAVDGDRVLGTASFMVASDARGRGVGRALGRHILDLARADGYSAMQFNAVVESNTAAVRLWQELGFVIIGTVPEAFEHPTLGRVGLHIMHRPL